MNRWMYHKIVCVLPTANAGTSIRLLCTMHHFTASSNCGPTSLIGACSRPPYVLSVITKSAGALIVCGSRMIGLLYLPMSAVKQKRPVSPASFHFSTTYAAPRICPASKKTERHAAAQVHALPIRIFRIRFITTGTSLDT